MTQSTETYAQGDWVVHRRHGVGEIRGTEVKRIGGPENAYYKIKTHNSIIWVPVDKLDSDWFRPLASPTEFQKAVEVLQRPPKPMQSNFKLRKKRIEKVKTENSLIPIARLVRDLWARQMTKTLTNTEQTALRRFTKRFLTEWSVCMDVEIEEARQNMYALLHQAQGQQTTLIQ